MPSTAQGGDNSDRARYPDRADEIGEDPARWLDKDLTARSMQRQQADETPSRQAMRLVEDTDTTTAGKIVRDRISGIDSLIVIKHWLEVESDLDRGPRDGVITLLQERADELKQIGERPDRLPLGPREPCDCCEDDGLTAAELRAERNSGPGMTINSSSTESASTQTATSEATLGKFATDGGDDDGE